jgi:hypothetical protein
VLVAVTTMIGSGFGQQPSGESSNRTVQGETTMIGGGLGLQPSGESETLQLPSET